MKKHTVAVPENVLSIQSQSDEDFQELLNLIRKQALAMGATYLTFKIEGGMALFESDSESFAQAHYSIMTNMLSDIIESLRTSCTYTVTEN